MGPPGGPPGGGWVRLLGEKEITDICVVLMCVLLDVGNDRFCKQYPISELNWREHESVFEGDVTKDCLLVLGW
jgi:hypothetical protein